MESIKMPTVSYLGFSAETGELNDNFDIIEVQTKNLYTTQTNTNTGKSKSGSKASSRKGYQNNGANRDTESSGGWGWFFMKIILFILVAGGGYAGYTAYRTSKRGSRFD